MTNSKPHTLRGIELTDRQWEHLQLIAEGWSNEAIADRLGITRNAVTTMSRILYRKFGIRQAQGRVPRALMTAIVWSECERITPFNPWEAA